MDMVFARCLSGGMCHQLGYLIEEHHLAMKKCYPEASLYGALSSFNIRDLATDKQLEYAF